MEWCRANLSTMLKAQNTFLFESSNGTLDAAWQIGATQHNFQELLLTKQSSSSTCFDQFLAVLRVLRCLPQAVVVAYSDSYGRHCRPIQYNKDLNRSQIVEWGPCQQVNDSSCESLQKCPPNQAQDENSWISRDEWTALQDRYAAMKTNCIHPSFIINLPADLICPKCCTKDSPTLVLSEFSYRAHENSPSHRLAHVNLVWNPHLDNVHAQKVSACEDNPLPSSKRPKNDTSTNTSTVPFPPRYAEAGLPLRSEPTPLKNDAKFCICIYCTACREFAIWAPASVCRHVDYVCHERGRQLQSENTTLGGALVRTKCSLPACNQATACPHCAHQTWHAPYSSVGGHSQVRHVSHCDVCRETYCSEHAWVSTVCHHW